ncbi:MAG: hypothetical protein AB1816_12670 [Bacillota bacterium]
MDERLWGRLLNYKFEDAARYVDGEPAYVKEAVATLNRLFGNVGWFDGDIALLVSYALDALVLVTADPAEHTYELACRNCRHRWAVQWTRARAYGFAHQLEPCTCPRCGSEAAGFSDRHRPVLEDCVPEPLDAVPRGE